MKGSADVKKTVDEKTPSQDFIDLICREYGDSYHDEIEDAAPGGLDWFPGRKARHKSLAVFQRELKEKGINLSTGKIRKILITGHLWSTERSREVGAMYEELTTPKPDGEGLSPNEARKRIAKELELSPGMVVNLLPYNRVVYGLEEKSRNAVRCDRSREKRRRTTDEKDSSL